MASKDEIKKAILKAAGNPRTAPPRETPTPSTETHARRHAANESQTTVAPHAPQMHRKCTANSLERAKSADVNGRRRCRFRVGLEVVAASRAVSHIST